MRRVKTLVRVIPLSGIFPWVSVSTVSASMSSPGVVVHTDPAMEDEADMDELLDVPGL
jgi:hypothetical protein